MNDKTANLREKMAHYRMEGVAEVEIGWDGEGYNGDYDPDDGSDEPLLRLRAIDLSVDDPDSERSRSYQDSSWCTKIIGYLVTREMLTEFCKKMVLRLSELESWGNYLAEMSESTFNDVRAASAGFRKPVAEKPVEPQYDPTWP